MIKLIDSYTLYRFSCKWNFGSWVLGLYTFNKLFDSCRIGNSGQMNDLIVVPVIDKSFIIQLLPLLVRVYQFIKFIPCVGHHIQRGSYNSRWGLEWVILFRYSFRSDRYTSLFQPWFDFTTVNWPWPIEFRPRGIGDHIDF